MQRSLLLSSLHSSYVVEVAQTHAEIAEAQRLRYQVFVRERAIFSPSSDEDIETDQFDAWSRHLLIRGYADRRAFGTARLITFNADQPVSFPIQRVCGAAYLAGLPLKTTGEISRFALSKAMRESGNSRLDSLLILKLVEGVLHLSIDLGLTHWCAVMEPTLIRLLRSIGIRFEPAGPMVSYFGRRQPAVAEIASILSEGRRKCPAYYDFVTRPLRAVEPQPAARIAA